MADSKISQLTGASTPLAGTEVLPIVQSGTTKKVSVSDLTAGRNVSMADLTTTGNTILGNASSDTLNVGNGGLIKDATNNVGVGVNPVAWGFGGQLNFGAGSGVWSTGNGAYVGSNAYFNGGWKYAANGGAGYYYQVDGKHQFFTTVAGVANGPVTWYQIIDTDTSGNVTLNAGNLVIGTSGKGITLPGGITWTSGSGSPEGVVTAPVGSLYSRSDGGLLTSLYVKESGSGNTGWAGK